MLQIANQHEEYTGLVEQLVGKALRAYIVFDKNDELKLSRIISRIVTAPKFRPKIYNMKPDNNPIESNPVFQRTKISHPRHPTVYDAFTIQNNFEGTFLSYIYLKGY